MDSSATPITLEDLETKYFTKKQIQDENVRLGLARCENERKAKSIAKLRAHLTTVGNPTWTAVKEEPLPDAPRPRKTIPKRVRAEVWRAQFGRSTEGFCIACHRTLNAFDDWHAGHIIPAVKGGLPTEENLRPLCAPCNCSMGAEDMKVYIQRYFPTHIALEKTCTA